MDGGFEMPGCCTLVGVRVFWEDGNSQLEGGSYIFTFLADECLGFAAFFTIIAFLDKWIMYM